MEYVLLYDQDRNNQEENQENDNQPIRDLSY